MVASTAFAQPGDFRVVPFEFDPFKTGLVKAAWLTGIGCPTNANTALFTSSGDIVAGTFADAGCPTTDPKDNRFEGLLLAKTGPTANFAISGASLKGLDGLVITATTTLGFDIRKALSQANPAGSHCGAGAPRFNITTTLGFTYFIGCAAGSPTATSTGFIRLRFLASAAFPQGAGQPPLDGQTVASIFIVFDEGQDTGPDFFGLAVLDNIAVNDFLIDRPGRRR